MNHEHFDHPLLTALAASGFTWILDDAKTIALKGLTAAVVGLCAGLGHLLAKRLGRKVGLGSGSDSMRPKGK